MSAKYYFINRPPFEAAPKGWIKAEEWYPTKPVENTSGRSFHGYAEYGNTLDFQLIWQYELEPADRGEYIRYWFWRDAGRPPDSSWEANLNYWLSFEDHILKEEISWGVKDAELALEYKNLHRGE